MLRRGVAPRNQLVEESGMTWSEAGGGLEMDPTLHDGAAAENIFTVGSFSSIRSRRG